MSLMAICTKPRFVLNDRLVAMNNKTSFPLLLQAAKNSPPIKYKEASSASEPRSFACKFLVS